MTADEVCAVLVTRGDVDMTPIIETLPYGEVVIWDNSQRPKDRGLFGRYMAIGEATRQVIYFQDDDCIVRNHDALLAEYEPDTVVGNFRRDAARAAYYHDTTLLGWGSLFDRDLPWKGWSRAGVDRLDWSDHLALEFTWPVLVPAKKVMVDIEPGGAVEWLREDGADIFGRANRMSNQPGFYERIDAILKAARAAA